MRPSTYEKAPRVDVPGAAGSCAVGWDAIAERLRRAAPPRPGRPTVLAVECYPGVDEAAIHEELRRRLPLALVVNARRAMLDAQRIDELVAPWLGGADPVFGRLTDLTLPQWFDPHEAARVGDLIGAVGGGVVLVVGCGATHLADADVVVYADLARREACLRFRRSEIGNLGADNHTAPASLQYKRAYFVDWRVADRWKAPLLASCDFVLDANDRAAPKLADGATVRRGLRHATSRPFRVVPFFDPAPWGGQWMRQVCDLDDEAPNYGWCFDCVPEENSLTLGLGDVRFELPALDLVLLEPQRLLGAEAYARFGAEFPIRFDFLDTMDGGNLSFQVHPLTDYIRQHFGMSYTQDESYYLLDAGADASVYLGLREDVDRQRMAHDLRAAQRGERSFNALRYANRWPAKKHDHFLIPAGTCHCSGANSMVLEISATPYIFTFKLWDWDRLGLDGQPRPIHLDHGLANIQWERTTRWVRENLVNQFRPLGSGPGWREEATGLHALQFIETRRHWFTAATPHHTGGVVNVLNLVEGPAALVTSPVGQFEPFQVNYAETFIVPAAVGDYTIEPLAGEGPLATIKAFVRTSGEGVET